MRRIVTVGLLLFVSVWGAAAQSAGPRGNDPLPIPQTAEEWLALSQDEIMEIVRNPAGMIAFFEDIGPVFVERIRTEYGPQIEQFGGEMGVAWQSVTTQLTLAFLGMLLLAFPNRLNFLGWFFVGIVAGVVVVQTSAANAILESVFPGEQQLQTGAVGVIVAMGLVGMAVGVSLNLGYFLGSVLAGGFAGALIGAQLFNGGVLDFNASAIIISGAVGSIAMSYAAGRGFTLMAAILGGVMLSLALGLPPLFGLLLGIISMIVMLARTRYRKAFQRKPIQKLDLEEGRVKLEGQNRPARAGDPASMKTMHDDSNNSPFKTL